MSDTQTLVPWTITADVYIGHPDDPDDEFAFHLGMMVQAQLPAETAAEELQGKDAPVSVRVPVCERAWGEMAERGMIRCVIRTIKITHAERSEDVELYTEDADEQ